MQFYRSDAIIPGENQVLTDHVLAVTEAGVIDSLLPASQLAQTAIDSATMLEGFLCPGFVNTHCHLELSHMKGVLPEGEGLHGFISRLPAMRGAEDGLIEEHARRADAEMWRNGIVACGDISNTAITTQVKSAARIVYHTFVELFDLDPGRTEEVFADGLDLRKTFINTALRASIVPHAPYTVTPGLMKRIVVEAMDKQSILSIHHQESAGENEMFLEGKGSLLNMLESMIPSFNEWNVPGKRSSGWIAEQIPESSQLILVHNTDATEEDLAFFKRHKRVFWCLCPKANLYIERRIPDIDMLRRNNSTIAIGTDSLASNDTLSVLSELQVLSRYTTAPISEMVSWATLNGARALGFENSFGRFVKGMTPGIVNITGADLATMRFTGNEEVKRVI